MADYTDCAGLAIEDVKKVTDEVVKALKQLPSAQAEIIRCKNCEYYHPYYCEAWSNFGTMQTEPDGFCYKAVREEGKAE